MSYLSSYSALSDATSYQSSGSEDFRYVELNLTVLGQNGILIKTRKNEEKKMKKDGTDQVESTPVLAVVSGYKEEVNGLAHLTSMPLREIKNQQCINTNQKSREYMALWPSNLEGSNEQNQTKLSFTKRIRRSRIDCSKEDYTYSKEKLILSVGLMKKNELITLGQVSIPFVFSTQGLRIQLPIRTTLFHVEQAASELKGIKLHRYEGVKKRRMKSSTLKSLAFSDNPGRLYKFHEDSSLSVMIQTKLVNQAEYYRNRTPFKFSLSESSSLRSGNTQSQYSIIKSNINLPKKQISVTNTAQETNKEANEIDDSYESIKICDSLDDSCDDQTNDEYTTVDDLVADTFVHIGNEKKTSASSIQKRQKTKHDENEKSTQLNRSSTTFSTCATSKLDSPPVYENQFGENYFSTVTVTSASTDSFSDSCDDDLDSYAFPSLTASSLTKNDSITSSWTFASCNK
jgi:hypothetical protein